MSTRTRIDLRVNNRLVRLPLLTAHGARQETKEGALLLHPAAGNAPASHGTSWPITATLWAAARRYYPLSRGVMTSCV